VLWTDPRHPDQAALARTAQALGHVTRAGQVLTVIASSSSLWAWLAAAADTGTAALTEATAARPAVRVAVGPARAGLDGFRRSHNDAVATQQLMARRPDLQLARSADVQLIALALADEQRAREFVAHTLGPLADADPDLRDTLCVYIAEQFSTARATDYVSRLLKLRLGGHAAMQVSGRYVPVYLCAGTVCHYGRGDCRLSRRPELSSPPIDADDQVCLSCITAGAAASAP
jgi:hypothetical protein